MTLLGVTIRREEGHLPARLAAVGLGVSAPGLLVLAARRALDVTEVDGAVELLAATTSTAGLCLAVIGGCLLAGRRPGRVVRSLAVAGSMPLSS